MAIERNCKNCAKESGCPECDCNKGNNYEEFAPKEELVRQDEKKHWQEVRNKEVVEASINGYKQALFDIAMDLEKDIPILDGNYKWNEFGFQKGYGQGQLEYAYVLRRNLIDKANRKGL